MKICRECGMMKSDNYSVCPECNTPLDDFEGYEEPIALKSFQAKKILKKKGWRRESLRHGLAAKGIKTGRKKSGIIVMPSYKKATVEATEPISGKKSDIEMFIPEGNIAGDIPDEEKERIFKKYMNNKNAKMPTKPVIVDTEAEARKIADVLTYYVGGAEITPTNNGKFKVTSKGYYHYIGV